MNQIEKEYVMDTYDCIAQSFDHTRYSIWNCVKEFTKTLDITQPILDAGCGNGKNMVYLLDNGFQYVKGCDFSKSLVDICLDKKLDVVETNILNLPFDNESFQNIICVAVLHHLSTREHRILAIKELLRTIKLNGKVFISVSSSSEPFCKKYTQLDCGDNSNDMIVGWKDKTLDILGSIPIDRKTNRYYHFFENQELEELCELFPVTISSSFECGNHIVVLTKT